MTILAEKESVAKKYAQALNLKKIKKGLYENQDIRLTYAQGHLYTLYDAEDYDEKYKKWNFKTLPIIPEKYRYKPIKEKYAIRKECENVLRQAYKNNDEIVIATDPDREGEVIARLILNALNIKLDKVTRIWATEGINPQEIRKSLEERKKISEYDLIAKQGICQKQSDWVMGINLTRAYSVLNKELYSIGRVQTAVLKEINYRHIQMMLFIPREYYEVKVIFENGNEAYLINSETRKIQFDSMKYINEFEKLYKNFNVRLVDTKKEQKVVKPPRLYDLALLQQEMYNVYNLDIDKTLEVAQKLYNEIGVISYPRADSVCLKDEDSERIHNLYEEISKLDNRFETDSSKINVNNKRLFNTKEVGAHHGLIPNEYYKSDDKLLNSVYDAILRRFLMQGMKDYVEEKEKLFYEQNQYRFELNNTKIVDMGWKNALLKKDEVESKDIKYDTNNKIKEIKILKKYTQKPKPYTQSTILAFMRNPTNSDKEGSQLLSIGTESTQATIIKTLFNRGYIETINRHIDITEKGSKIIAQLRENRELDSCTEVETTTQWELIGKENPEKLLTLVENKTIKSLEFMGEQMKTVIEKDKIATCPICAGNILKGKKGFYCSNYKEVGCNFNLYYKMFGNEIDEKFLVNFLEKKETEFFDGITKEGDKIRFRLILGPESVITEYDNNVIEVCDCPKCKANKVVVMKKVFKCCNKDCDFFMWRETSGIKFSVEDMKNLCLGQKISKEQTKKDGSVADVKVSLDIQNNEIKISY